MYSKVHLNCSTLSMWSIGRVFFASCCRCVIHNAWPWNEKKKKRREKSFFIDFIQSRSVCVCVFLEKKESDWMQFIKRLYFLFCFLGHGDFIDLFLLSRSSQGGSLDYLLLSATLGQNDNCFEWLIELILIPSLD